MTASQTTRPKTATASVTPAAAPPPEGGPRAAPREPPPAAVPLVAADIASPVAADAAPLAAPPAAKPAARAATPTEIDPTASGVYVQFGAFRSRENAETLLARLKQQLEWLAGRLQIHPRDGLYRVHAGPYSNPAEARQIASRLGDTLSPRPMVLKW